MATLRSLDCCGGLGMTTTDQGGCAGERLSKGLRKRPLGVILRADPVGPKSLP